MILTKNGNLMKFASGAAVNAHIVDPYNPLGLPPFTIRCKFRSGYTPTKGDSQTLVDAEENVWDIYKNSTDWSNLLAQSYSDGQYPLLEVLGANTTGVTNMFCLFGWGGSNGRSNLTKVALFDTSSVTNMQQMFQRSRITTIPLFDTSSVTNMNSMFGSCTSLVNIPLIDTSKVSIMSYAFYECSALITIPLLNIDSVTNVDSMFQSCINVESGALALYQQLSTKPSIPRHSYTFYKCGSNTTTGAAELAQIPSSWGGTAS